MKLKYIFFILFIFNRSYAFIVNDYSGALEGYNNLNKPLIDSLNKLKEHISTVEFIYSDDTKESVNGYVDGNSFFILSKLLSPNYFLKLIKQIQYFYNHKLMKIETDHPLRGQILSYLISGSAEIVEAGKKINFDSFSNLFMDLTSIYNFIFETHFISGRISDLNTYFITNNLGLGIDYYQDVITPIDKTIHLYSNNFSNNLWFIIGKPDGITVDELHVIQLNYINPNIFLFSVKVEGNARQSILMIVDGTNFKQYDVGAYLVRCIFPLQVKYTCKFFGQITKVATIDQIKQVIVVDFIGSKRFTRTIKLTFKNKTVDAPDLMASNRKGYEVGLNVEGGTTSMTVEPSRKTHKSMLKSSSNYESQELLGDQEHLKTKKQRMEPISAESLK